MQSVYLKKKTKKKQNKKTVEKKQNKTSKQNEHKIISRTEKQKKGLKTEQKTCWKYWTRTKHQTRHGGSRILGSSLQLLIVHLNPFRTALPFSGQNTLIKSSLSPKRAGVLKGLMASLAGVKKKHERVTLVWCCVAWHMVWYGMLYMRYGIVWCGMVWPATNAVRCGAVWYGMVWYDMVWYVLVSNTVTTDINQHPIPGRQQPKKQNQPNWQYTHTRYDKAQEHDTKDISYEKNVGQQQQQQKDNTR